MAPLIEALIEEYDFADKLGCFVTDNAPNNDTAIGILALRYRFNDAERRLRCIGHIINLVVKAIILGEGVSAFEKELAGASDEEVFKMWRQKGPIGKLHNIIVYIYRSKNRRDDFQSKLREAYKGETTFTELVKDFKVRWNATEVMIVRGLQKGDGIDLYCLHEGLTEDRLSQADWEELERFAFLLGHFKQLTKRLEGIAKGGSHGAIWEVVAGMDYMMTHLEALAADCKEEPESYYKTGIDLGFVKLREYYYKTDASPIYRAAIVLHPALKWVYFEEHWTMHPNWIKQAKKAVKAYWLSERSYYEVNARMDEEERLIGEHGFIDLLPGDCIPPPLLPTPAEDDAFDFDAFLHPASKGKKKPFDEYDQYCAFPVDPAITNPILWWREHQQMYPVLSRLAINLFAIPGMSSECERIFSDTQGMITDERARLHADTVQAEECVRKWIKEGVVRIVPDMFPGLG